MNDQQVEEQARRYRLIRWMALNPDSDLALDLDQHMAKTHSQHRKDPDTPEKVDLVFDLAINWLAEHGVEI